MHFELGQGPISGVPPFEAEKVKCPRISLGMEGQGAEKVKCPRVSLGMGVQRAEKVKCPRISLGTGGQGAEKVKCPRISLDMGSLNPNGIRGHLTFSAKKLNAHESH